MKVTYTEEINAEIVVTARLSADGEFRAVASGSCLYAEGELPGATASAEVDLPPEQAQQIKASMTAAIEKVGQALGARIARAKAEAYRVSVQQREIK